MTEEMMRAFDTDVAEAMAVVGSDILHVAIWLRTHRRRTNRMFHQYLHDPRARYGR